jgi:hypothetical protein
MTPSFTTPRTLLRAEGLAAFLAATGAYLALGGSPWLFLLLALAPDLSMLGYLAGPRIGSRVYNAAHTTLAPAVLAAVGIAAGGLAGLSVGVSFVGPVVPAVDSASLAILLAFVWLAHIGIDRAVGYGLKYPAGFDETHLSGDRLGTTVGRRVEALHDVEGVEPDTAD